MARFEKERSDNNKLRLSNKDDKVIIKKKEKKNVNGVSKLWSNLFGLGRLSNDKKHVNVENIISNRFQALAPWS